MSGAAGQTPAAYGALDGDRLAEWRRGALNVYSGVAAVLHLLLIPGVVFYLGMSPLQQVLVWTAWALTCACAVLRRLPTGARVGLLVVAVWLHGANMLLLGGVFMHFRLALYVSPLAVIVLSGVRPGLLVGAVNLLYSLAAFWATDAGYLRQTMAWRHHDLFVQSVTMLGQAVPSMLLFAWFSHHLATSSRREQQTAVRLREEAARHERLEREGLQAAEQESLRIGNELHDGVCQDLTALLIRARRTQKALAAAASPEAGSVEVLARELGEVIGEIHTLSRRLSPGVLSGRNLDAALDDLARRYVEILGAVVTFRAAGDRPALDPPAALHLYRIAQEAIANAVQHASASRIEVTLEGTPRETLLLVDDDGRGLGADATGEDAPHQLGLRNMAWRAAMAGGAVTVGPRPGGGTRVACRLPRRNTPDATGEARP